MREDSLVEEVGEYVCLKCSTHDDDFQFPHLSSPLLCGIRLPRQAFPFSLNELQATQQKVGVQCPFVRFVDDDDVVSKQ